MIKPKAEDEKIAPPSPVPTLPLEDPTPDPKLPRSIVTGSSESGTGSVAVKTTRELYMEGFGKE